jgi:hypothetical protein
MYSPTWQALGFWTYVAGLLALATTTALQNEPGVRWSALVLLASLAAFAVNLGRILSHGVRPRVEPLNLPVTLAKTP